MPKLKLTGKQIRTLGYPEGPVISIAMQQMHTSFKHCTEEDTLKILKDIFDEPEKYLQDAHLSKIAIALVSLKIAQKQSAEIVKLNSIGISYNVFGAGQIEEGALQQMEIASRLPVSIAGALMPDAHHGYGLPIGGVLATENVIIPYAVGVDIGCRMCLSIFDISPEELKRRDDYFHRELVTHTLFGAGREFGSQQNHSASVSTDVLDKKEFYEIPFLRTLQNKAASQLGSSGSGNHFVEFGIVEIAKTNNSFNVPAGKYVGLLSHSGSRGLGASIAANYTQIAKEKTRLPDEAKHLAWLDMNTEAGIEYWLAMNLAGDYASACHHTIHNKIVKAIGQSPIVRIENHHNFAWKERFEGREVIVHRKGATPAGKDVLGIIPGSMTAPGFIVKGKGEVASLSSAAHGAGRKMSRTKALSIITHEAWRKELAAHDVKLTGGGLDEAPFAYKDIHEVMKSQHQLVDILGKFYPKIVVMDGTPARGFGKKRNGKSNDITGE